MSDPNAFGLSLLPVSRMRKPSEMSTNAADVPVPSAPIARGAPTQRSTSSGGVLEVAAVPPEVDAAGPPVVEVAPALELSGSSPREQAASVSDAVRIVNAITTVCRGRAWFTVVVASRACCRSY